MENIKYDFHVAGEQEQNLEEAAILMERAVKEEFSEVLENIQHGWKSSNSKIFLQKLQMQSDRMLELASSIRESKQALHNASIRARHVEEKAKEIAENRTANI